MGVGFVELRVQPEHAFFVPCTRLPVGSQTAPSQGTATRDWARLHHCCTVSVQKQFCGGYGKAAAELAQKNQSVFNTFISNA